MKKINLINLVFLLAFLLSSCSGPDTAVSPDFEGREWVLTDLNGGALLIEHRPTILFEDGQVSGSTGCNSYGGTYQIDGRSIGFKDIYQTEMACLDPPGRMAQESHYLDLLQMTESYEISENILTFFSGSDAVLVFQIPSEEPISSESTIEPTEVPTEILVQTATPMPALTPPKGFNPYRDPQTGVSIYIPESWIVTGIVEGQYAILQSYPEDKYVGGEMRAEGDTKCDLSIRSEGERAEDLIQQWQSDSMTTIVSTDEFSTASGLVGQRFVVDSMGRAIVFLVEIERRVVLLTCFGNFDLVDEIAETLHEQR